MASNSGFTANNELRLVMMGKTGNGKSATGNTILGQILFRSEFSAASVTVDCSKYSKVVDGQTVTVIDTPGLFDTRFDSDKTTKDVSQCINYSCPGPHVFLVVIRLGRYTPEEMKTVQMIQEIFGDAADRYSMVLFTGGDQLEGTPIEDFVNGSPELQELVRRCNGQYHVFNNKLKDQEVRPQVSELLQKIKDIIRKNGGSHYTNAMYQEAERKLEEEKQRILEEKQKEIQKEKLKFQRELQKKLNIQMEKINKKVQAERKRERKEREEERKKDKQEWDEERRKEMEMRDRERQTAREERDKEISRIQEDHERERTMEQMRMMSRYENMARQNAERVIVHSHPSEGGCTIC